MQSMNDEELRTLLRLWEAPATPCDIEARVFREIEGEDARSWAFWLIKGSVRVPVPALISVLVLLVLFGLRTLQPQLPARTTLADFQPVKELKPRIIRSNYENR